MVWPGEPPPCRMAASVLLLLFFFLPRRGEGCGRAGRGGRKTTRSAGASGEREVAFNEN